MSLKLRCIKCAAEYPLENHNKCKKCNGILNVSYGNDSFEMNVNKGVWRYASHLPLNSEKNIVTLGEGNTPLVKSRNIYRKYLDHLYFKVEGSNPTGSFKDRGMSVAISKAKELGISKIMVASSGNAAASAAAYSAKANMECFVLVPTGTDVNKVKQSIAFGAKVKYVEGSFSESFKLIEEYKGSIDFMNTTTTFINPYNLEGNKTISYEIYEQMDELPDKIIIPIGAGPVLVGMYRGFLDLYKNGDIKKIPELIGIQSKSCSPIYNSYINNEKIKGFDKAFTTLATGIADPLLGYEDDGEITLDAIRITGGCVEVVDDDELLQAKSELAEEEGLLIENTSAAAVAGIKKLIEKKRIKKSDKVVCILSGNGLKSENQFNQKPEVIYSLKDIIN